MSTIQISLRPGQRIYLNGAVIRADRKVTLELMNDATFLLEGHILQAHETHTPLRQLYYVVQTMLMAPETAEQTRGVFRKMYADTHTAFASPIVQNGLVKVATMVESGRTFDALRTLRLMFPMEDATLLTDPRPAHAA